MSLSDVGFLVLIFTSQILSGLCSLKIENESLLCFAFELSDIWLIDFLANALTLFSILVQLFLTAERIILITPASHKLLRMVGFKLVSWPLLLFTFAVYSLVLLTQAFVGKSLSTTIQELNQSSSFNFKTFWTQYGESQSAQVFVNMIAMLRVLLVSVALLAVNVVAIFRFRNYCKQKLRGI
jgi:hypothetical protein